VAEDADAAQALLQRGDELQLSPAGRVLLANRSQLASGVLGLLAVERYCAVADGDGVKQEAVPGEALVEPLGALLERGVGHRSGREPDPGADHGDVVQVVVDALELEQERAGAP
jgi:hypothetical protein